MICRHCGATVDGNPEHCPTCGALLAQTGAAMKASTGDLVTAFFLGCAVGIGIDVALFILGGVLIFGIQAAFANRCMGETFTYGVVIAIAVAIPAVAFARSYKKPAKDGLLWAGIILTTFVPFLPCSLALIQPTTKC